MINNEVFLNRNYIYSKLHSKNNSLAEYNIKSEKQSGMPNRLLQYSRSSMPSKISNRKNIIRQCYYPFIHFCGTNQKQDYDSLKANIPNLHSVNGKGLRGESLSIKRNLKYIPVLKDLGIRHVIDLKTSDFSKNFQHYIEKNSMTYSHFPIDSEKTPDKQIIDILPEFFKIINDGSFYIACAQGLHRTDIALSVNYIFNKDEKAKPPVLYGHIEESSVRFSDIFRRTNSIYKNLTYEDKKKLGLETFDDYEYKLKKKELIDFNNKLSGIADR